MHRVHYRDLIADLTQSFTRLQSAERSIQRLPVCHKRTEVLSHLAKTEQLLNELDALFESTCTGEGGEAY